MENLAQIETIRQHLGTASRKSVGSLYNLIFEEGGDRKNRSKLREFAGLEFEADSDEFRSKLDYSARFSVGDLISICKILGLDYTGDKEQLRQKIINSLIDINLLFSQETNSDTADDDDDNNEESENDEEVESLGNRTEQGEAVGGANDQNNVQNERKIRFTVGFGDVEETIREFKGSDDFPIERWIADFEDAATLFGWEDLQKVIFAKKSFKGLAKLFVQSESGLNSWKKLKTALLKEFSTKVTSAQLHTMLTKRKIKDSESVQGYFLSKTNFSLKNVLNDNFR